jgi:hypothetical protein
MVGQLIDYVGALGPLPNPQNAMNEAITSQLGIQGARAGNEMQRQQIMQAQRKAAQDARYGDDMARFLTAPNLVQYGQMIADHPEFASQTKAAYDAMDAQQRKSDLSHTAQVYAAANGGRFDLAAKTYEARRNSDHDAGMADPMDDAMIAMLKSGDPGQQQAAVGILRAHLSAVEPDKFASTFGTLNKDSREAELQPFEMGEAEAKATTAQAEAEAAPGYYAGRSRKVAAEADIAATDSAWRVAKNSAAVAQDRASASNLYSLIQERGKVAKKAPGKVTVGDIMSPIYAKVAAGTPLTPGENVAWGAYTRAPKADRVANAPAVAGGRAAPTGRAPAPVAARPAGAPVITDPRTGKRMTVVGGKWVPVR